MGYGLLLTYGVSRENPCPPSWWTEKCMGYRRLWVIKSMGYGRFDCSGLSETRNMKWNLRAVPPCIRK